MTNQERGNKIKQLKADLDYLLKTCPHEIIKSGSSAKCCMCNQYFGWYCPDSIDHICDYEQEDGSYDEDHCIYCRQPEERK